MPAAADVLHYNKLKLLHNPLIASYLININNLRNKIIDLRVILENLLSWNYQS